MEKCEKIGPETYLPRPDCDGTRKYDVPSPPERDVGLTQAELEEYTRSYEDPTYTHVWFLYSMSPRLLYIIVLRIRGDRLSNKYKIKLHYNCGALQSWSTVLLKNSIPSLPT